MPTVIVRHKVGDFATWIKGHQERVELFKPFSSGFQTFQDGNDPNSVILAIDVNDMDKMQAVMRDPKNDDVKAKHTVIEPIIVSMPVKV